MTPAGIAARCFALRLAPTRTRWLPVCAILARGLRDWVLGDEQIYVKLNACRRPSKNDFCFGQGRHSVAPAILELDPSLALEGKILPK
jgi:hypothetical protein